MAIAGLADGNDPAAGQADRHPAGAAQGWRIELEPDRAA
jgi:hypothetical protein